MPERPNVKPIETDYTIVKRAILTMAQSLLPTASPIGSYMYRLIIVINYIIIVKIIIILFINDYILYYNNIGTTHVLRMPCG